MGIPLRILLVADRPFVRTRDGSTVIYKAWLSSLEQLGHRVSVLSFNHQRVRWDAGSIDELNRKVDRLLIVNIHSGRLATALYFVVSLVWRMMCRRRHLPQRVEAVFARRRYDEIRDFLGREKFDAVVVNKVRTTVLMGPGNLGAVRGPKVLDIHDDFARRSVAMRATACRLLRRHPVELLGQLKLADLPDLLSFASEENLRRRELKLVSLYDRVLFSSGTEAAAYASAGLPAARIIQVPWPLGYADGDARAGESPRPFHIGFLASNVLFNFEAALFLAGAVLPRLKRARPELRVLIAGSICRAAAGLFAGIEGMTLVPSVDRIEEFYNSIDVAVVPLLSGTGVSIKAMEAAWFSSAIVSTATGVRGLQLRAGVDFLLADNADDIAAAILRLLTDSGLRRTLGQSARQRIGERHSTAAFAAFAQRLFDGAAPGSGEPLAPLADRAASAAIP